MNISTSHRVNQVETYYFATKLAEIRQRVQSGQQIINLGIGSPDLPPAKEVIETLSESAKISQNHGYQSYRGSMQLKQSVADWYQRYFDVTLDASTQILPLIGSKEGIMHISMTYLQEGDTVLVPDPGYPSYASAARLAGAAIAYYDLVPENDYLPDLSKIGGSVDMSKVKIMWLNYPHMPTGARANRSFYESLLAFAKKHNVLLCSDNPYSFLHDDHLSLLSIPESENHVIELMSMSKNYHMAGWRVGFMSSSAQHIDEVLRFKSNMDSGMFLPVQLAAAKALSMENNWLRETKEIYSQRREMIWAIVAYLDLPVDRDKKGLFVWSKIEGDDDKAYIENLLDNAGVFIAPGSIFGKNGKGFVRFSLCQPTEIIEQAFDKIKAADI